MSRVTLRKRAISGGRVSLFLDIYPPVRHPDTGQLTRKQYLKIYLYAKPKTELERFHNKETMELAMNVTARTQIDVQNLRFGFMSTRMRKGNFVEYMESQLAKHRNLSNRANWKNAIKYFKDFAGETVLFPELTQAFSEEYVEYLLSGPALGRNGTSIRTNTAVSYFAKYRACLKQAFKDGLLPVNLYEMVNPIPGQGSHREFLFLDELQKLADTSCSSEIVKRACLFAALTGLRYSDVATITWEEIRGIEGNYYIQYSMVKTDLNEFHPIPDQAYYMLGAPSVGVIFKGLRYCQVNYILPVWLKAAGITKHISFHCFRHTFATLQIILGTDIVTLSRLLGHQNIGTTMIYVKIVDQLKREASHRIRLEIGSNWLHLGEAS